MRRFIYFTPVKKEYLKLWDYYTADFAALEAACDEVVACSSLLDFLKHISKADYVYCWWWSRSFHILLISKLLNKKVFITGALHMFDESGGPDFYNKSFFFRLFNRLSLKFADVNLLISKSQLMQITSHLNVKKILSYITLSNK